MKNRSAFTKSLRASILSGLMIVLATAGLTSCHSDLFLAYKFPQFTFAGRPIPPSKLAERVMVAISVTGSQGSLEILDALRDIRNNIQSPTQTFFISGSVGGYPQMIYHFPAEVTGFVYSPITSSSPTATLSKINYGTEASSGAAAGLYAGANSIAIPPTFGHYYAALEAAGQLEIVDNTSTAGTYGLNIPGVYQVAVNAGDSVVLAMVQNSDIVYRVIKLNVNQYPTAVAAIAALGAVDCQPLNNPIYCALPVNTGSTSKPFDRPVGAYFSLDGTTAYILNCGAECGGTTSSVTYLQQGALQADSYTVTPSAPNPNAFSLNVPVPGGVTTALSNGTTLYVAGQSQNKSDGLFAGNLSTINLATNAVTGTYSISDGYHSKLLFADDNTLWIGSQNCATGERFHQASLGLTTQAANYNCLSRFDTSALTASVVPAANQNGGATVPYPNTNLNQYYYGDLTGLCWVQTFHKVYTAYGGQVHAFNTADGSEINNANITVQGTALDVAYLDSITDADN